MIFFGGLIIVNAEEAYTITSRAFYNASGSALGQQTFPNYYVGYLWTKNTETTGISGTWYFYGTNNQSNITLPTGTTSILINANIYHGSADQISTNYTSSSYINYLRANFQIYVIQSDNTLSQCIFTGNVENNVSVKCPVDKSAYKGFRINYSMDDLGVGSQIGIGLSQYYIYSRIDNSDLETIIRAQADRIITSDETTRTQIIATINSLASSINGISSSINNQTTTINNNHDEIMDTDIDSTTKENVDTTSVDNYNDAEADIMDQVGEADLTSLSIGIDRGTSSTIWNLITRIIQSNAKIFGLFISILSIGIIKIALAR